MVGGELEARASGLRRVTCLAPWVTTQQGLTYHRLTFKSTIVEC